MIVIKNKNGGYDIKIKSDLDADILKKAVDDYLKKTKNDYAFRGSHGQANLTKLSADLDSALRDWDY